MVIARGFARWGRKEGRPEGKRPRAGEERGKDCGRGLGVKSRGRKTRCVP